VSREVKLQPATRDPDLSRLAILDELAAYDIEVGDPGVVRRQFPGPGSEAQGPGQRGM
jgi:hypothetical protein